MDGWMAGWRGGWVVCGWMGGWMVDEWIDVWTEGWKEGWKDGRIERWMKEPIREHICHRHRCPSLYFLASPVEGMSTLKNKLRGALPRTQR